MNINNPFENLDIKVRGRGRTPGKYGSAIKIVTQIMESLDIGESKNIPLELSRSFRGEATTLQHAGNTWIKRISF